MRHLCAPEDKDSDVFPDGAPKEGISVQHVLTRIGQMALIRKKVNVYEENNGETSMPKLIQNIKQEVVVKIESDSPLKMTRSHSEQTTVNNDTKDEKGNDVKIVKDVKGSSMVNKDGVISFNQIKKEVKEEIDISTPKKQETKSTKEFNFNIADGGFTELHLLWKNEEKAARNGKEYEIWNRRHDYWLLCGITTHGYARWADITNDTRFAILNEPFKADIEKGSFREIKNKFYARRLTLLQQALVIEEQLRKISLIKMPKPTKKPKKDQNNNPVDVDEIAKSHRPRAKEIFAEDAMAQEVLFKTLDQVEDLVSDMKNEIPRLPASLVQIPTVAERLEKLQLSEKSSSRPSPNASGIPSTAYENQITPAGQFPDGFQQGQWHAAHGINLAQFRNRYSVPG